jgi:hypothetical protein
LPVEVEAHVAHIYQVVRNDPACHGPVGLLQDAPTHTADGNRSAGRKCAASVAAKLGLTPLRWSEASEHAWRKRTVRARVHPSLRMPTAAGDPPLLFTAQQFWDLVVWDTFFKCAPKRERFFFEAGARDGLVESNTYFFEKYLGWRGLLMEPSPFAVCNVPFNRPNAHVVRGAFCESRGPEAERDYRTNEGKKYLVNIPFFMDKLRANCSHDIKRKPLEWKRTPCHTFAQLRAEKLPPHVDLFSLDIDNTAEERAIMSSEPFTSGEFRPSVILQECKDRACVAVLQAMGYSTLYLENSRKGTYFADVMAWRDTCAAWKRPAHPRRVIELPAGVSLS